MQKPLYLSILLVLLLTMAAFAGPDQIKQIEKESDLPSFLGWVPDRFIVVMQPEAGKIHTTQAQNTVVHIGEPDFDRISDQFNVIELKQQFAGTDPSFGSPTAELAKYHKITISSGTLEEAMDAYRQHPMVERVEPIGIHAMFATPNDSYFDPYQWYHNQANDDDLDSPEAWNIQTGSSSVIVAILDSGTRYYHRDLGGGNASPSNVGAARGNMWINNAEQNGTAGVDDDGNGFIDDWIGWDFIQSTTQCWSGEDCGTQDNDPRDFNGHGTHTSGLVGMLTNNGYGMAGVAGGWGNGTEQEYGNGVKVMACRMGFSYNYLGQEYGVVYMDAAAEAFYYAADNGASIASCSWGSSNSGGIAAAATYFINNGGMIFVASGNDGNQTAGYLNSRADCISVSATDQNDAGASFTNYGTWVDISAPGVGIYSTLHDHTDPNTDYWASMDGTSMACPIAAGVAAMIWSQNPGWTAAQVESQLYSSADNIEAELSATHKGKMGAGRVNLYNAVNTGPPPAPVAAFTGSPTSGTEPLNANFTDQSTGSITDWAWTFGDGGSSTAQSPSYTYTSAGTYSVTLTVTGPGGSDALTKTDYITVNPCVLPTAGFVGVPTSGDFPLNVSFTDQSTGATSYNWNFGDGGSSTSASPSYTYTTAGTFTVTQTVTNSCGTDQQVRTNYITVTTPPCDPPVAGFAGTPTSGDYPLNVSFTDASTNSPTSWAWTFGDGGSSTVQNPSYTYTTAGTYTVTLTATNSCGSDGVTKTSYITVTTPPCNAPVAEFSGTPTSGNHPLLVSFTDASTNSPTSWAWTFGDGGSSTVQNPSYTYTAAGTYTVILTATNSCGSDGVTKTSYITVTDPSTGVVCDDFNDADISDWTVVAGEWTPSGGGLDGTIASGYAWILSPMGNVGEATITVDWTSLTGGTWTNGIIVFGWVDNQNYRVVDCRDGANKWYIREFISGTQYNRANFAENINTNQLYQMEVVIDASGLVTVKADGVTKVSYNFGNVVTGQVGLEVNQSHSLYDNFCVDQSGGTPSAPTAEFVGTPLTGDAPLQVNFTDQSTNGPTSWGWDFGDGGNSTAQNPSYTYTTPGVYTVTLTATNAQGSDAAIKTDYITVTDPGGANQWWTITYDEFESGFGNYTDGGGDCSRYTGGTYAHQGSSAILIRDNSGVASSFYHTNGYDVTGFSNLEVEFWYYPRSMDNSREDFWVQYFNGSSWVTIAEFVRGTHFENGSFYNEVVSIPAGSYNYPTDAKLRFMCDASGNQDYVYIDEVEFRGYGPSGLNNFGTPDLLVVEDFSISQNYPNPFNPSTTIGFSLQTSGHVTLTIYNIVGQQIEVLADRQMSAGRHEIEWNATGKATGVYFYRLVTEELTESKKMILLK